jgi:hypothetical protein
MDRMKKAIYFSMAVTFLNISCISLSNVRFNDKPNGLSFEVDIMLENGDKAIDIENAIDYPFRINSFLNEGFGCQFTSHKVYGYDILSNFGEIKNISLNKNSINNDYVNIEFNSIVLHLYDKKSLELYYNNELNEETFKDFKISAIYAKENIEYLYGIKIGMYFQEFINIFGEINSRNNRNVAYLLPSPEDYLDKKGSIEEIYLNNIPIVIFPPQTSHYRSSKVEIVLIMFKENKIDYIRWTF